MSGLIETRAEGGVQIIRLNRPEKKNALTGAMYAALSEALAQGERADDVRVRLFLGSGGVFCAGNDIGDFLAAGQTSGQNPPVWGFLAALVNARKPLVAAVDGPAVGIGATLLLHCDLVYATPEAVFHTPFTDLALVPEAGSSLLAPRLMGHQRAFALLVAGEPIDADEAFRVGLVNTIVLRERLEAHALAAARKLAAKPPQAVLAARRLLKGDTAEITRRIEDEAAIFRERMASAEAREAFAAFLEKRPPDFSKAKPG